MREQLAALASYVRRFEDEVTRQFALESNAVLDRIRDPEALVNGVVEFTRGETERNPLSTNGVNGRVIVGGALITGRLEMPVKRGLLSNA